jgi:two-component system phosphate regulon response regulator PhoB
MVTTNTYGSGAIHVLAVDDDAEVRDLLVDLLTDEGLTVATAADADTAMSKFDERRPDVVLLDVVMPSMNGLDLLSRIRRRGEVPVIFVSGRGGETDRVLGLRMGADDYVVKPFSGPELVARIYSVLRRSRQPASEDELLHFGRLTIDLSTRDVEVDGKRIDTTAKEFDLLAFLARSPRRVFSREQVLEHVWDSSTQWQDPATVTEHIRRLRKKIEDDPDHPHWLRTVRGVGYRFEA